MLASLREYGTASLYFTLLFLHPLHPRPSMVGAFSNLPSLSETSLKVRFLKVRDAVGFCNEIPEGSSHCKKRKEKSLRPQPPLP
jgi:hypothetical protein